MQNAITMLRLPALLVAAAAISACFAADGDNAQSRASGRGSAVAQNPTGSAARPEVDKTTGRYSFRDEHDPNGIGKFYMGREIARVMSFHGAPWLERQTREQEERLSLLVNALNLKPGMVVADIGAGSGVVSLLLAEPVGPDGKVLAVDIQEEMLLLLDKKLKERRVDNVRLVLGTEKSPRLKPASVDLALLVDVYHEFAFPHEMLREISNSLKPGGRVVLVEYRKEDPRVPIKLVHKMTEAQVKKELSLPEFNLKWRNTLDLLPRQHVVIFERIGPPRTDAEDD